MILRAALLVLVAAACFAAGVGNIYAQSYETLTIEGKVVNGTAGAELPGQLGVLLLVNESDGALKATGQAVVDADGRFTLNDVAAVEGGSYTLSVDYGGAFYGTTLTRDGLSRDVTLTIYEPTQDAGIVGVDRQVMLLASVDKKSRTASALEFVQVTNSTDLTLLPDLTVPAQISFLRLALPPEASDLTVQSDLRGGEIISIGSGFALTAPVPPGTHTVDFSYSFPYQGDELAYRQSLPQGAGIFQVLTPARLEDVAIPGMTPLAPIDIEGTVYRAWETRDIPPGKGLELVITGLPQPAAWDRLANSVSNGAFWQIAIPSAVGASLAAFLIWGLTQRQRPLAGATVLVNEPPERAGLVRAVALLDERFQQGAVPEDEYRTQRQEMVARILDGTEASGGPGPEER